MATRGRPTKDESEKAQVIQFTIISKDKDEIDEYAKMIGYEGREKEFYRASLLSSTSATQYLDFENRVKSLETQIKQLTERHARDKAKLEQAIIDLDKDFNEDIKRLESEQAIALANIESIKRIGDKDGALTNAKDGLSPLVQADKERIQATIQQRKFDNQSSNEGEKLFSEFLTNLSNLDRLVYDTTQKYAHPGIMGDIEDANTRTLDKATPINWAILNSTHKRTAKGILNKPHFINSKSRRIQEIRQGLLNIIDANNNKQPEGMIN